MIIEGEFLSGGHLRWNLGWPTPNYAGAFLATLLALAFVFSGSRWRWWALAVEAGGIFLLAKTYSRGAVVAWGLAWLFGVAASRGWRVPAERLVWAARVVVLAVMMLAIGFGWSRAAGIKQSGEATVIEDGSVVNRLALWRGGLKMIAAAPLTGWGAGESGRAYMNWFQELDRDEGYTTMVNSYLHVAVEHGLPVLAAVLWVGVWLLVVAGRGAGDDGRPEPRERLRERGMRTSKQNGIMAAGAALVAWAGANVFTTLWIEPRLWVVPTVACLVLGWSAWNNPGIRLVPLSIASLAIAVFAAGGLYGAGRWLLGKQALGFMPGTNGSVMLVSAGPAAAVWHAWPDPAVLGSTPGKEFRRWLEKESANVRLVVHRAAPLQPGATQAGAECILLFGRQAERIGPSFSPDCRELWLLHPTVPPPVSGKLPQLSTHMTTVVLPQIDEAGNGPAWRRWAKQTGARVVESPASGLDIRAAWPGALPLHSNQPLAKGAKEFSLPSRESL